MFRRALLVFSSLNLTIGILLSLGCLIGYATLYEMDPASGAIRRDFYRSAGFLGLLALLGANLVACTLIRAPLHQMPRWLWNPRREGPPPVRPRQIGYVTTHCGLMLILAGSMLSLAGGVEGVLPLSEKEVEPQWATSDTFHRADLPPVLEIRRLDKPRGGVPAARIPVPPAKELSDGPGARGASLAFLLGAIAFVLFLLRIWEEGAWYRPVPFLFLGTALAVCGWRVLHPPAAELPRTESGGLSVEVLRNVPKAALATEVRDGGPSENPALLLEIRFQDRTFSHWLFAADRTRSHVRMGPLQVIAFLGVADFDPLAKELSGPGEEPPGHQVPMILVAADPQGGLAYLYTGAKGEQRRGAMKMGEEIRYEFMPVPLHFRAFKLFSRAWEEGTLAPSKDPNDGPGLSVRLTEGGKSAQAGVLLDAPDLSMLLERNPPAFFSLAYRSPEAPLGFSVTLDDFRKVDYPGTERASSYESDITVRDASGRFAKTVRVNDPLAHGGFKLYQQSYAEDSEGRFRSVFAVSRDPGVRTVYAGFLLFGVGLVLIFYLKPVLLRRERLG